MFSRLAGTTEYWVNDQNGQPFLFFTGDLNERLKDAIEQQIVPALIQDSKYSSGRRLCTTPLHNHFRPGML